jgi:deoxyribonuclease V
MKWPKDLTQAKEIQREIIKKISIVPLKKKICYIAGVDAAFFDASIVAVASLFSYPDLVSIEDSRAIEKVEFPYIPGFLTFREGRSIIHALRRLNRMPDLILVDGQGIAHPRGVGIASHLGVVLATPTIGCAKSRLIGEYDEPGQHRGDWSSLRLDDKTIGAVLRTRANVKPVFVSPGHMINLSDSIGIVMNCCRKYRIPEPLRRADMMSKMLRNSERKA